MRNRSNCVSRLLLLCVFGLLAPATPQPVHAQDELFVMKHDSLRIKTFDGSDRYGSPDGWHPNHVEFTVRGSIPSGGQFEVSFGYPAKRQWFNPLTGFTAPP